MSNRSAIKVNRSEPKPRKKRSFVIRALRLLLLLLAIAAAALIAVNLFVVIAANSHIVAEKDAGKADAIIVLGALVVNGDQPSYMLQDRLDVGYELYKAGAAPKILVSGDHGTPEYDEVNAMRKYLEGRGVPTEDIFMDHAGFDTYDTMYRARDIFEVKSAIIVTQRYHLYRAVYLAGSMGLQVQGVACDRYKSVKQPWFDLRELAARAKSFYQAEITRPKSRYLGDQIPISGSGVLTHDEGN
jgi:SanA protein